MIWEVYDSRDGFDLIGTVYASDQWEACRMVQQAWGLETFMLWPEEWVR